MCDCPEAPMCEMWSGACGRKADGFAWTPITSKVPLRLAPKFACKPCWEFYCVEWAKPIKGITKPEGADDEWRPSLMDMIRHAEITAKFDERHTRPAEIEQPSGGFMDDYWRWYERHRGF